MATGQGAPGKNVAIGSSNISLCVSTADSFIWTSARCSMQDQGAAGEALRAARPGPASCLAGEVRLSFEDADKGSLPQE